MRDCLRFFIAFFFFLPVIVLAELNPIQEIIEPEGKFSPKQFAKVAVLQWVQQVPAPLGISAKEAEKTKAGNRKIIENYIREAANKGAKLVVTPECSIVGYPYHPNVRPEEDNFLNREEIEPYVETDNGPSVQHFSKLAKELGIYIHIGFAEVDKKTKKYHNTVVALMPDGSAAPAYRKIHLFGGEPKYLSPGDKVVTYDSIFGKIGMAICSDVYSNHPMDEYQKMRLDALALSTSWAQWNSGMDAFQRGAKWVRAPLLAANQSYYPDSGVINADGTKQSHIRQSSGLAYGYLQLKDEAKCRAFLKDL